VKTPRLKEWREARGETQVTLSERSGVAEHTISRIEHGASLRPSTARKLANALDVSVADLMERPPVPSGEPVPVDEAPKAGPEPTTYKAEVIVTTIPYDKENWAWAFAEAREVSKNARELYDALVLGDARLILRDDGERIVVAVELSMNSEDDVDSATEALRPAGLRNRV
jgi:transcriptional regulator with XRE-family HTH domain